MPTKPDDLTRAGLAMEAERLRERGFSLSEIDAEEWRENDTVRVYLQTHRPPSWSSVWRFTNEDGETLAAFMDGAAEVVALVSLEGKLGRRRKSDTYAAAVLATQI